MSKAPVSTNDGGLLRQTDANNLQRTGNAPEGSVRGTTDNRERRPSEDLGPNVPATGEESRDIVQQRLDKRSAANEEGHKKNMEAEEKKYEKAETVDSEDGALGKPDPKLGREDNGNTPIVNPDGSKTWTPPGVAFAKK
jgi:hypothetical protein